MAKKATKKAPGPKFPKTPTRKAAPKAKAKKPLKASAAKTKAAAQEKHKTPRTTPLPGFEQVTDASLNRLCERISDNRAAMNDLRQNVEADSQAALDRMLATKRATYHHSGVELVVRPGAAKLSVRTFAEKTSANLPEESAPTQNAEVEAEGILEAGASFGDEGVGDDGDDVTAH